MDNPEETIIMRDKHAWPYLAGIIDGEGCLHIADFKIRGTQQAYRLDIHVTTTSLALAKWLVGNFGGVYYHIPSTSLKWRDAFRWQPSGARNKERLLLGVLPHLVIKRALAEICLEFLRIPAYSNCPEYRAELSRKAREFSRRGRSVETDTQGSASAEMIQSELASNDESAPTETLVA